MPDRTVIVELQPRTLLLPTLGVLVMSVGGVWAGTTSNTGIIEWMGSIGEVIVIGLSVFMAVALVGLIVSNLVFSLAVLVGSEEGLQLVYPFGLHRFTQSSRLIGNLGEATIASSSTSSKGRFRIDMVQMEISAPEGMLRFTVGANINTDWEERFQRWAAARAHRDEELS